MTILWLGQQQCNDVSLVGGKAANLSYLAAEYNVPPGFCLSTEIYQQVRNEVLSATAKLPDEIAQLLNQAYQELASRCGLSEPSVAVRSSAVDEDGSNSSFAGQHETYLNIIGIEAINQAVLDCWATAHSERALNYRSQQGLSSENIQLAILIQQLIAADSAAVAFSANPITKDINEIIINANFGLGESIVGGTTTPDSYTVGKSDLSILKRQAGQKQIMTIMAANGTREVPVPRPMRNQQVLNDQQIIELAQLCLSLEKKMNVPVDIECAFQGANLYLLQCRPITTL